MLTVAQRKRLAREARRLAMECVEGTAPPLRAGFFYDRDESCAVGWVAERARVAPERLWDSDARAFDGMPFGEWGYESDLVISANDSAEPEDRQAAVVFPLLALADALEAP